MFTFTPTELQVSSSCNMTNQLLFLCYNLAEKPVTDGSLSLTTAGYRPDQFTARIGSIGSTEANLTIPDRQVQQFGCICFIFKKSYK